MKKIIILQALLKSVNARGYALNPNDADVLRTILNGTLTEDICKQVLVGNNSSSASSTSEKLTEQGGELSQLGRAISIAIANFLMNNYKKQSDLDLGNFLATTDDDTKKTFRDILIGKIKSVVDTHYKPETNSSTNKKETTLFDNIYATVTKRLRTYSAPPSISTETPIPLDVIKPSASSEPASIRATAPTPTSSLSSSSALVIPTDDASDMKYALSSSAPIAAKFHK